MAETRGQREHGKERRLGVPLHRVPVPANDNIGPGHRRLRWIVAAAVAALILAMLGRQAGIP